MEKLRSSDYVKYNPEIHVNHCKSITTGEIADILDISKSLAQLSVELGRTVGSINDARRRYMNDSVIKKSNELYYRTNAVQRYVFKRACARNSWNMDDFIEIYSHSEFYKNYNRKIYLYKRRTK